MALVSAQSDIKKAFNSAHEAYMAHKDQGDKNQLFKVRDIDEEEKESDDDEE